MAKKYKFPAPFRDSAVRAQLAIQIEQNISSSNEAMKGLRERAATNMRNYKNFPEDLNAELDNGEVRRHIAIQKPRVAQRVAQLASTVFASKPYFRLNDLRTGEGLSGLQDDAQSHLDRAAYADFARKWMRQAAIENIAFGRAMFVKLDEGLENSNVHGSFVGMLYQLHSIHDFHWYPFEVTSLVEARQHGHRFMMLAGDIEDRIRAGTWADGYKATGITEMSETFSSTTDDSSVSHTSAEIEDTQEHVWDILFRTSRYSTDGSQRYWRVLFHEASRHIFAIEPYAIPVGTWYQPISFDEEIKLAPDSGPAQDLQGPQAMLNDLFSQLYFAYELMARPAGVGPTFANRPLNYKPGTLTQGASADQITTITSNARLEGFESLLSFLLTMADSSSRVSNTLTGGNSGGDTTATEEMIRNQAFQLMSSDDVQAVKRGLIGMMKLTLAQLKMFADDWKDIYSADDEILEDLERPILIQIAGEEGEAAPNIQQKAAQEVLKVLMEFSQFFAMPEFQASPFMPLILKALVSYIQHSPLRDRDALADKLMELLPDESDGAEVPPGGELQMLSLLQQQLAGSPQVIPEPEGEDIA